MSEVSKSLLKGAREALYYAKKGKISGSNVHKVEIPDDIDVASIRQDLHMTRQEFSNEFGFNMRTLEKWEQGVRRPEGPARAYLVVIAKNPKAVSAALRSNN